MENLTAEFVRLSTLSTQCVYFLLLGYSRRRRALVVYEALNNLRQIGKNWCDWLIISLHSTPSSSPSPLPPPCTPAKISALLKISEKLICRSEVQLWVHCAFQLTDNWSVCILMAFLSFLSGILMVSWHFMFALQWFSSLCFCIIVVFCDLHVHMYLHLMDFLHFLSI